MAPAVSTMTTALIYTRVSSDEQARSGLSLDAQLAECRRYAARQGWIIGDESQDVLKGTRDDRPAYQALLAEVRRLRAQGQNVAVVVAALDRFGRSILERVRSRDELKQLGVPTHSVREGGEVSDLVANVLASVAQEEVRRLGERVSAVRSHLARGGWAFPGRAALGYRYRPATGDERRQGAPRSVLEIDPERAPVAREVFERVANGQSVRAVGKWLAALPAEVRQDRAASYRAVRSMLSSRTYLGQLPDGSPGKWEPLIDADLFERVQARTINGRRLPKQASGRYLLTGMIRCPACGTRMGGSRTSGSKPARYHCISYEKGARAAKPGCYFSAACFRVDGPVLAEVGTILERIGTMLRSDLEAAWGRLGQPRDDLHLARAHEKAAERAKERIRKLALLYADDAIDREGYELGRQQAQRDLEAAAAALEELRPADNCHRPLPDLDEVLRLAGGWSNVLAQGSTPAVREVLSVLVEQVVPERTGWARFEPRIAWSPAGAALQAIAQQVKAA